VVLTLTWNDGYIIEVLRLRGAYPSIKEAQRKFWYGQQILNAIIRPFGYSRCLLDQLINELRRNRGALHLYADDFTAWSQVLDTVEVVYNIRVESAGPLHAMAQKIASLIRRIFPW